MIRIMLIAVVCALAAAPATADMRYYFTNITNNSGLADDIAASQQLSVVVSPVGSGTPAQVSFTFFNTAAIPSNVTEIYFEDGTLFDMVSVINNGTSFVTDPVAPPTLPGGEYLNPPWDNSHMFAADVDPVRPTNPLNAPTDSATFIFDLFEGLTYEDVLSAIQAGREPGPWEPGTSRLRIGMHVRAINGGNSDAFIIVPLPGAVLLGLLGLGAAGMRLRRAMDAA